MSSKARLYVLTQQVWIGWHSSYITSYIFTSRAGPFWSTHLHVLCQILELLSGPWPISFLTGGHQSFMTEKDGARYKIHTSFRGPPCSRADFVPSRLSNSRSLSPPAPALLPSILRPGALVWNLLEQESPAAPCLHISMPTLTLPDRKEPLI